MTASSADQRRHAPAAERNAAPILAVLQRTLPATGTVLEIASGTGQHAAFFAPRLASRRWQPTEPDPELRRSIAAWSATAATDTLLPVIDLDAGAPLWPVETAPPPEPICAIVAINMIHIAPWAACLGLLAGAGRILPPRGVLYLYGPFSRDGRHTAPSNAAFDSGLRRRDAAWGIRDVGAVAHAAAAVGLAPHDDIAMPANNLSLIFRRS